MVEMAQFLAIGACAVALLRWAAGRWSEHAWTAPLRLLDLNTLSLCLAFSAIGFHLGNYFCSGLAKLLIGPHLLTWIAENQTQNIMIGALKRGVRPSGHWPVLTQRLFAGLGDLVVISNALIVAVQLFAILAVLRLNWFGFAVLADDNLILVLMFSAGCCSGRGSGPTFLFCVAVRSKEIARSDGLRSCVASSRTWHEFRLGDRRGPAWWDVTDIRIPWSRLT